MGDNPSTYSPGLEGVIAGTTKIGNIDLDRGLFYRGYKIGDLGERSNFEEVAYLLLLGKMPTQSQLNDFCLQLDQNRALPQPLLEAMQHFPKGASFMDRLRSAVSILGMFDPEQNDSSIPANLGKAIRLVAGLTPIITASWRVAHGQAPLPPKAGLKQAEYFLYSLTGKIPDPADAKAFDTSLILYAEHGFNASTFAARVTTSTMSDIYSATTSAIGTLKGPLHGGANEEAMKMLLEIGSVENAERWVRDALAKKKKIMGFGHRVYKNGDARTPMLKEMSRNAGLRRGDMKWFEISDIIDQIVVKEKGLFPNVDFYSASLYYYLGIPIELYTPIFAAARVAGWTAHILEQQANNRLIRPACIYDGTYEAEYLPIEKRG